jgi:hypothetical protein
MSLGDYTKTAWETGDTITAVKLNNNEDKVEELDEATESLSLFPTAGGTGTVITVSADHFTLTAGCQLTFIASAANSAAATTLNVNGLGAKNVYKPNTTDAPNIISGKAYTVWYDGTDFFVKASAEGDAVAAEVLASKTFSNDDDVGITGTMPNKAGDNAASSSSVSGTTLKLVAPEGYYDGSDDTVTLTDADFVAANIKDGVDIFGVEGSFKQVTAGDSLIAESQASKNTTSYLSYTKAKSFTINASGTYRTYFELWSGASGYTVYGRIYKNGVAYGTERSTTSTSWQSYSEDLDFEDGDECELYYRTSNLTAPAYIGNYRLKCAEVPDISLA